jgi:hypothetical protein
MPDQPGRDHRPMLPRRSALGLAGAAAACLVVGAAPRAAAHGTLVQRNEIWGQPTHYYNGSVNNSRTPTWFYYNPTTYTQAEDWFAYYYALTPGSWLNPSHLWLNGVHDDDDKASMHLYGRAIDLQYVYMTINGSLQQAFNADYLWWRTTPSIVTYRKRYWAFCASLNYFFNPVLHYWFTPDRFSDAKDYSHQRHVHADDGASGPGVEPGFVATSARTVQTYNVQSCLVYIWNIGLPRYGIDGSWGSETDGAVRLALSRIGRSGTITNIGNYRAFLSESVRAGTGGYVP